MLVSVQGTLTPGYRDAWRLVCLWILICLFVLPVHSGTLQAGAAMLPISAETPNNDRLEIDALVLRAGEQTLAFCTVDCVALDQRLTTAVAERLAQAGSRITREGLLLAATHTHVGAYRGLLHGLLAEQAFGTFSQKIFDQAAEQIVACLREAEGRLQPARVRVGEGAAPQLQYSLQGEGGPTDPTVGVLVVETRDGVPLAYLVNYAAHPTVLYQRGPTPGRDFPGGLATTLRETKGQALPVLFVTGAAGDLAPIPEEGVSPTEQAFLLGKALAEVVLTAMNAAPAREEVTLKARTRTCPLPPALLGERIPAATMAQELWLGDVAFLALPGEPCCGIGLALREKARAHGVRQLFLCGLANDYTGYHPTPDGFFAADLESQLCLYGPLMQQWYQESYLTDGKAAPVPLLAARQAAYQAAKAEGARQAEAIRQRWATTSRKVRTMMALLRASSLVEFDTRERIKDLPSSEVGAIGEQYLAFFARKQLIDLTPEDRARLIGIADGVGLPFDAIMTLQYLSSPKNLPSLAKTMLQLLDVGGYDLLGKEAPSLQ